MYILQKYQLEIGCSNWMGLLSRLKYAIRMKGFSTLHVAKASNLYKSHALNKDIYVYKSLGALIINI